jgi:hypothetical protein
MKIEITYAAVETGGSSLKDEWEHIPLVEIPDKLLKGKSEDERLEIIDRYVQDLAEQHIRIESTWKEV